MSTNNGGTAFPRPLQDMKNGDVDGGDTGMSLRQWYAGMAMQAMFQGCQPADDRFDSVCRACAAFAFQVADAMLAHEQNTPPNPT